MKEMLRGARSHVSKLCSRLGEGGAGQEVGAGAPDTCWGCELLRLLDAGSRFRRRERLARLQPRTF